MVENTDTVIHKFDTKAPAKNKMPLILAVIVLLGIGTGYLLSNFSKGNTATVVNESGELVSEDIKKGNVYGVEDESEFDMKEIPEGLLKEGGIEGEGEYHLEREGGSARNVYLTSSQIDLSKFVDRKVKVWGMTYEGQSAGWLMDVGRVEVLD